MRALKLDPLLTEKFNSISKKKFFFFFDLMIVEVEEKRQKQNKTADNMPS